MSNIILELEKEQMTREVPDFGPGDTVVVQVKVKEGSRERLQAFEGVCIGRQGAGLTGGVRGSTTGNKARLPAASGPSRFRYRVRQRAFR